MVIANYLFGYFGGSKETSWQFSCLIKVCASEFCFSSCFELRICASFVV